MTDKKKASLTARIVTGMGAGILTGIFLQMLMPDKSDFIIPLYFFDISLRALLIDGFFEVIGQVFISSLQMLVVPLVFVSLICGTCSLKDTTKLGRIGGKAISLYLVTTAIAISFAMFLALLISPGEGVNMTAETTFASREAPSLAQVFIQMFPSNPFAAFAQGNMLQVIIFALLFGIAIALSGKAGERIASLFEDMSTVIMRLVTILMNLAPYGVFCLLAALFTDMSPDIFANLLVYFLVVFFALVIHATVTYSVILKVLTGLNPLVFLRKMRNTVIFAFSTASSNATLPITLETVTKKMGVKNSIASFTVPLGATINMDGTAIMQGVATVFIAQVFNVDLSLSDYLMVILTATLASIGTAGVPGVGLIMLAMVLGQVGLPVEGIGLIIGVDRLLDMTRTAVNVTGDSMVSIVVGKSENQFDESVFNDENAGNKVENIDFQDLDKNQSGD
ncbi:dicarboxylate/amino acid:cation symporter [Colwellia hornerae]|uniref:Dicarboxylate/amino acid:cation symporter n=1 Tax=Colwellia hornerae TaxID=89402 RepID=A0A5C6QPA3_9GAMM|nr:dicarboxylate/amino acid:cation symporter [Colwellia hornerae]TWX56215.1 dicarboxylate/amino acid:cation symporter [Colwellia hornerae]TWX62066.1 dicarboxylate/amino acid:cation symporter [Colwellia hornerae]TWX70468.1 dicarboxylate/amino acid:cation symporter [Colwellia hornerae]